VSAADDRNAAGHGRPDRPRRRRRHGLLAFAVTLALLALLALAAGFAWFLSLAATIPAEPDRATDGIAVLTGGAERVETGLRLLRQGKAGRLLVSGVHPDVTLADLARMGGQEPEALAGRVTLGRAATSTRGNAQEIADWAKSEGLTSLRIVTAGYHMPRALLELRRALPQVALVPHPVVPARLRDRDAGTRLRTWSLLAGEYLKLLAAEVGLTRPDMAILDPKR
jgi:uncharacterized SAM-binding protein YcdF (DUF218 family)